MKRGEGEWKKGKGLITGGHSEGENRRTPILLVKGSKWKIGGEEEEITSSSYSGGLESQLGCRGLSEQG